MTVTLTPVERDDLRLLFKLEVADSQDDFVAPNAITLAQAPYETGAYVFCIRSAGEIVGLIAMIDFREHAYLEEYDDPQAAYLWRLMLGEAHQNKGIGRAAMGLAMGWARDRGNPSIMTSAVEANAVALRFYESLGFARTGDIVNGEVVLARPL